MTEIAGLGATHPLYGNNRHGSIGCAIPDCSLRIADVEDASVTMPNGEVGELMVRGPITMMGYFGDPCKTRDTIEPDGWLHTGDLGTMDADGCVYIVDRKKDMILTGGYNVYPAEIERVLAGHPDIALAAVGKQADDLKGELARAYVVLKPDATCSEEDVIAFCRKSLAANKCPRSVLFVDDVPKTSNARSCGASCTPWIPSDRRFIPGQSNLHIRPNPGGLLALWIWIGKIACFHDVSQM